MKLFRPEKRTQSEAHRRIYAYYELCYTAIDFAAAGLFIAGSVFFFWESTTFAATWMFLVGSVCFALKPTIRLMREIKFLRMGEIDKLAEWEGG